MATFRERALVNDHRDEFSGEEQIRARARARRHGEEISGLVVALDKAKS